MQGVAAMAGLRQDWLGRFEAPDFDAISADKALMQTAMPAAARLFEDNCAVCHGQNGGGNQGFPVLKDGYWLWGGDPATIAETLRVGINSPHPETRYAQMPAFDWMDRADRRALAGYVAALPSGTGGLMNGAPSLADASAIYVSRMNGVDAGADAGAGQ